MTPIARLSGIMCYLLEKRLEKCYQERAGQVCPCGKSSQLWLSSHLTLLIWSWEKQPWISPLRFSLRQLKAIDSFIGVKFSLANIFCIDAIHQFQPKMILLTLLMYHLKKSLEQYYLELHCLTAIMCQNIIIDQTHTLHNVLVKSVTFLLKFLILILEIFNNNLL